MTLRALSRALGPLVLALSPFTSGCGAAPPPAAASGFQLQSVPFPKKDELAQLSSTPPPAPPKGEDAPVVSRWELLGPLPETFGDAPFEPQTHWEKMLAESLPKDGSRALSTAMRCVAREVGAFSAVHKSLPAGSLRDVIAARCGAPFGGILVATSSFEVEDSVKDQRIETELGPKFREYLQTILAKGAGPVGLAAVRKNGKVVIGIATYEPRVLLEPTSLFPDGSGNVTVRGKLLEPATRVHVVGAKGPREVVNCTLDPRVVLPSFSATCPVDPADPVAWLEVMRFQEGRLIGHSVVEANIYPAGKVVTVYEEGAPPPDGSGAPADRFATVVNGARVQLGLPPLTVDPTESQTSTGLAPHYFAAAAGSAPANLTDTVALGLMAGWDVGAPVREGLFGSYQLPGASRPEELALFALERPMGRRIMLAPNASRIALGLLNHDGRGGRGVSAVASVYTTVEPLPQAELARVVFERLDAARIGKKLPAATRLTTMDKHAEQAAAWIEGGTAPGEAMNGFMRLAVEETRSSVRAFAQLVPSLDGFEPPAALVDAPGVALAVSVASYRPEGSPWVMWVVLYAAIEPEVRTAEREGEADAATTRAASLGPRTDTHSF